jgi:hypothetical protein
MKKIYLVTTIHLKDPDHHNGLLAWERERSVGWFPTLLEAWNTVMRNDGDIYEMGHYNHCVIEEVDAGLYPACVKSWWFKWKDAIKIKTASYKAGYRPIKKPEGLKNIVNFGIG